MNRAPASPAPPHLSPRLLWWFMLYVRPLLRRQFHGVRVLREEEIARTAPAGPEDGGTGVPPVSGQGTGRGTADGRDSLAPLTACAPLAEGLHAPVIVYLNHASWWDPLICLLLAERCFPGRPAYAPMDSVQLERYGIFKRLGIFGVAPGTARGARDFLKTADRILADPAAMLWIMPQARFADVRERPLRFSAGLARLVQRFPQAQFLPLAVEYVFWNERRPEALAHFGVAESGAVLAVRLSSPAALTEHLEKTLTDTMETLAEAAIRRDAACFRSLLHGAESVSGIYDLWRRARALACGEPFRAAHGAGPSPAPEC